jgi:pilus assembly protein Flp/PilA
VKVFWKEFLLDEAGVTAIEYSLIAGMIAIVIVGAITTMGTSLNSVYTTIATALAATP